MSDSFAVTKKHGNACRYVEIARSSLWATIRVDLAHGVGIEAVWAQAGGRGARWGSVRDRGLVLRRGKGGWDVGDAGVEQGEPGLLEQMGEVLVTGGICSKKGRDVLKRVSEGGDSGLGMRGIGLAAVEGQTGLLEGEEAAKEQPVLEGGVEGGAEAVLDKLIVVVCDLAVEVCNAREQTERSIVLCNR